MFILKTSSKKQPSVLSAFRNTSPPTADFTCELSLVPDDSAHGLVDGAERLQLVPHVARHEVLLGPVSRVDVLLLDLHLGVVQVREGDPCSGQPNTVFGSVSAKMDSVFRAPIQ